MTLRKKLIASFGTLILAMLIVFSLVVYVTFAEGIRQNRESTIHTKLDNSLLTVNASMHRFIHTMTTTFLPLLHPRSLGQPPDALEPELKTALAEFPLFSSIALVDAVNGRTILQITPPQLPESQVFDDALTARLIEAQTTVPTVIGAAGSLYLLWPLGMEKPPPMALLAARLDLANLQGFLEERYTTTDTMLVVSHQDRELLRIDRGQKDGLFNSVSMEQLIGVARKDQASQELNGLQIFSSDHDFLDLELYYILSATVYHHDLLLLKNRIITSALLLLWVGVWTILIISHRMTKPIVNLAQISEDMISFNYTTPLDFPSSSDEIGMLAKSFEAMRQKIEQLVTKDPLTGVYNRRYLMHTLDQNVNKAIRNREKLSCLMLDIDHFKSINDTYGHQTGDQVLKELGLLLSEGTRNYDTVATVARYGGEEFTIILPGTGLGEAHSVAERLRTTVESHRMSNSISCTMSLGVAVLDPSTVKDGKDLINLADQALYDAKEKGRNRTIVHGDPELPPTSETQRLDSGDRTPQTDIESTGVS